MKNKIVISIGSLLACIALVSVLIAAVGPPPILRNSMTTNQNVWEKSGSSMTWTGTVSSAGVMSAGTTGTASTNLTSYGQLLGAITNGINQVITGGTNQTYGTANLVNSNGVVNALGPFSSATTGTASSNLVTYAQMQAQTNNLTTPGSDTQILFNKGGTNGADSDFIWDWTNHRLGIGSLPDESLTINNSRPLIHIRFNSSSGSYIGTPNVLWPAQSSSTNDIGIMAQSDVFLGSNLNPKPLLRIIGTSGLIGVDCDPVSKLDVSGGVAIGTYAGSVAAPANGLAVSGVQTNGSNVGIAGVYQAQGSVGISTSEKVITQTGTTNLNVWVGGILVSNITNYHD